MFYVCIKIVRNYPKVIIFWTKNRQSITGWGTPELNHLLFRRLVKYSLFARQVMIVTSKTNIIAHKPAHTRIINMTFCGIFSIQKAMQRSKMTPTATAVKAAYFSVRYFRALQYSFIFSCSCIYLFKYLSMFCLFCSKLMKIHKFRNRNLQQMQIKIVRFIHRQNKEIFSLEENY